MARRITRTDPFNSQTVHVNLIEGQKNQNEVYNCLTMHKADHYRFNVLFLDNLFAIVPGQNGRASVT